MYFLKHIGLIFLLGSSVWEHCYKVCSSVNKGEIYFVHCKSATETSLDMAAVLFRTGGSDFCRVVWMDTGFPSSLASAEPKPQS